MHVATEGVKVYTEISQYCPEKRRTDLFLKQETLELLSTNQQCHHNLSITRSLVKIRRPQNNRILAILKYSVFYICTIMLGYELTLFHTKTVLVVK